LFLYLPVFYFCSMILHSPARPGYIPEKIISLVPSQTELLFHLGLDKSVAGITKFCVHPPEWKISKTIIGGTKNSNIKKIKDCRPDLIIANKEENVKEQVEELAEEYTVFLTDVNDLEGALQMITDIGIITHTESKAEELVKRIETGFTHITTSANQINTCYLIWRKPYMTAGGDTFINAMLAQCGFNNLFSDKKRYPIVEIEELKNSNCRLLILSSEPYPFKQPHIDELQQHLPNTKIILADGEMFSWYGSRLLYAPDYFNKMIALVNHY
jgi:ABC-type Fe3+-hydroxamate transport system substrate-binding protein